MSTRSLRVLLCHPGASWSTHDVYDGLLYGLNHHGVTVFPYRLDRRIETSGHTLHALWRRKRKLVALARRRSVDHVLASLGASVSDVSARSYTDFKKNYPASWERIEKEYPNIDKPNEADVMYHASCGVLEMALRQQVDVVLIVSASLLHPDVIVMMKRAGLKVVVLFTESPYDQEKERRVAELVDGCWTNERTSVPFFRDVNKYAGYIPHGWHPERHFVSDPDPNVPEYDVVFVGTGFPERINFFNAIDWSGINLALYGTWKELGLKPQVEACVKGDVISNADAAALYRRSKICLNLYRVWKNVSLDLKRDGLPQRVTWAESLSPRAYELAACGIFHLSDYRAEVDEVFGDLIPTFKTPLEAAALMRYWLKDDQGRARVAAKLPACVAGASWVNRSAMVLGDLTRFFPQPAALAAEAS